MRKLIVSAFALACMATGAAAVTTPVLASASTAQTSTSTTAHKGVVFHSNGTAGGVLTVVGGFNIGALVGVATAVKNDPWQQFTYTLLPNGMVQINFWSLNDSQELCTGPTTATYNGVHYAQLVSCAPGNHTMSWVTGQSAEVGFRVPGFGFLSAGAAKIDASTRHATYWGSKQASGGSQLWTPGHGYK